MEDFPTIRLERIRVQVFRHPLQSPVSTSFGTMQDRPAVFVRLEADDGAFGWGEIFANWPAAGAEHRARLLIEDISELVLGCTFSAPGEAFHFLERATHVRALQCGEWGPFRQVIAGLDQAMHDLFARRAGKPVRRMLDPAAADAVPAYASGIHVDTALQTISDCRNAGFRRFKVKVGFDMERDIAGVIECLDGLEPGETLYIDANQAWSVEKALHVSRALAGRDLGWIEEPILADAPWSDWERLAVELRHPLAGGENIAGFVDFAESLARTQFRFYQPDIAKWGGYSGCRKVALDVLARGFTFCPHFLGGAVGLHASANLLASVGGGGVLEVDVNPNPLRDCCGEIATFIRNGNWVLPEEEGIGFADPTAGIEAFQTLDLEASACGRGNRTAKSERHSAMP